MKCPGCSQAIFNKDLATNLHVCPKCSHHFRIGAAERLKQLLDGGGYVEHDEGLISTDPLGFVDTRPYPERLRANANATGLKDAIISATGAIDGRECVVLAMEYSASTEDLQRTMHAHPTLSEALHEAALNADKIAIDFPNR